MAKVVGKTTHDTSTKKSLDELLSSQRANVLESNIAGAVSEKNYAIKEDIVKDVGGIENSNSNDNNDMTFSDLVSLFGEGFNEHEMRVMHKKFISLQNNYPLRTEMHKEALITYVKYAFKRDKAIADDDMDAADKWGKLCAKQATDAKINPSQLSAADLSDGISNFSKIAEAVEREQDIIPILPKFKQQPQDVVDYTIWQYVNYIRRLQNMPDVKYEDIYKFMDEMYEANKKTLTFVEKEKNGHYDSNGEV